MKIDIILGIGFSLGGKKIQYVTYNWNERQLFTPIVILSALELK